MVKLLLEAGADVNTGDKRIAAENGHVAVVKLLQEAPESYSMCVIRRQSLRFLEKRWKQKLLFVTGVLS